MSGALQTFRRPVEAAALVLAAGALWCGAADGEPLPPGTQLEQLTLPTLDGGKAELMGRNAKVNVVLFFRPGQEFSALVLKDLAACEQEMAGKPVHFAAVVTDQYPGADVQAAVTAAGVKMPVFVDGGAALSGRYKVIQNPAMAVIDGKLKLVVFVPYTKNHAQVIRARIRHALGELTDAELDTILHPPSQQAGGLEGAAAHRHLKLAERLLAAGNAEKAADSARKALDKDPNLADAHALLGAALALGGDCAGARKAFDAALALDKQNARALQGRKECEGGAKR
ncbi:MAG: redoxin domain-containing protein [Deltaproteobacteria bacterium]|nr:redoxin domain-containing protein [Deltaproteobacteria bacterium]